MWGGPQKPFVGCLMWHVLLEGYPRDLNQEGKDATWGGPQKPFRGLAHEISSFLVKIDVL